MRVAAALTILALMSAGCSGAPEAPDDTGTEPGKAYLRGIVVDAAIQPIPNAVVQVVGHAAKTTSQASGGWLVEVPEPGTYQVRVTREGFEPAEAQGTAEASLEPPVVRVELARIRTDLTYATPMAHDGFIACEFIVAFTVEDCDRGLGVVGEADNRLFFHIEDRIPTAYQAEVVWEANQELARSMTSTQGACRDGGYCSPYDFGATTMCQQWGPSPLWCRVNHTLVERSGSGHAGQPIGNVGLGTGQAPGIAMHLSADCAVCTPPETPTCQDACGVGVLIDQEFSVFVHVFYGFEPAAGWLFVEDGAPPVPDG